MAVPHYGPPTHAMQIFRYAEEGSIKFLWISGTNPRCRCPSSPGSARSSSEKLFVVVQDLFLTETAALADVVLPAATWGEKTGVFTNADRTVHLSEKAVPPPGDARSDLDIFLTVRAADGIQGQGRRAAGALDGCGVGLRSLEGCSAGRPCDYTGITYDLLRERGGVQWPCTADAPDGTERLYTDHRFWAAPDICESYGRDLISGASVEETEYRALNPDGKAVLKAAEYLPPHEEPDDEYPAQLTTGRTIYHFHTRTKTARARSWSGRRRCRMGRAERRRRQRLGRRGRRPGRHRVPARAHPRRRPGRRGTAGSGVRAVPLRLLGHRPSGRAGRRRAGRAANELTITDWDPVSKQPLFKTSACRDRASAGSDQS